MEDPPTTSIFMRNKEAGNRDVDDISILVQRLIIPEPNPLLFGACTKPLAELRRTTVAQLQVNKSAIGSYLLLRTLSQPVTVPVNSDFGYNAFVLVEDHVRKQTFCCLYGHVHLRSEPELKELLPVDAVFALKEPYLIACSEQFVVVVGGPSDLVVVGRSHVLYKDAEVLGWREKTELEGMELTWKWSRIGDNLYQERKFYYASDAYLFALKNCSDTMTKILLQQTLALSFLVQDYYEPALVNALEVLEIKPFSQCALYCAGRAQYELREYTKARLYFQTLNRTFPSNENFSAELARCEKRLRETEGIVDIYSLYLSSLTDATLILDHGNFSGNIIFLPGPENVRGVFATQDMEPGTLILVEKAVVTSFEPSSSFKLGVLGFMRTAFRAALKNPKSLSWKLSYLPGGCTITDNTRRIFCDEVNELEPFVDVRRLHRILKTNICKTRNNVLQKVPFRYHAFELASRFQQCCLSNCYFHVYKDVVVVRTCTSVLEGEELYLRHCANRLSFRQKRKVFKSRSLTCSCSICALDEKELTKVHDLRQKLKKRFDAQMALGTGVNSSAEEKLLPIVKELELSYRNRDTLRLLLFLVYRDMAKIVDRSSKDWREKVTLYVEKGLQSVGLSTPLLLTCAEQRNPQIPHLVLMPAVLLDYAGIMAEKEYSCGRLDLVEKWVKIILLLERFYRGGNIEMLKERFLDFEELPDLLSSFA